jgi:2-dehydro-3-deoxyphosphogluconate aldolase/(4S)-4-hydroxy-2-oxoglutarate aldolase
MPSGGIDADNAADYLRAGALAVNVGTSLCPVAAVAEADTSELNRRASDLRRAIDGASR